MQENDRLRLKKIRHNKKKKMRLGVFPAEVQKQQPGQRGKGSEQRPGVACALPFREQFG